MILLSLVSNENISRSSNNVSKCSSILSLVVRLSRVQWPDCTRLVRIKSKSKSKKYICGSPGSVKQINTKLSHLLSGMVTKNPMKRDEMSLYLDGAIHIVTVSPVGCDCKVWLSVSRTPSISSIRIFPKADCNIINDIVNGH